MKNRFKKSVMMAVLLSITLPVLSGCVMVAAAGAGAGAFVFMKGSLNSHLNAPAEDCFSVVREGMKELGYIKIKELSDMRSARFTYRDPADTKASINLVQKQRDLTEISIRIGYLGDEDRSILILKHLQGKL